MHVAIRAILSILVCLFLPLLLASLVSSLARIGVVELTLLYIIVFGCVAYSWQYTKRKRESRLAREKAET